MAISNEVHGTLANFFNSQRALFNTLGDASRGCSEELIEMSMSALKTGLAESTVFTRQLLTAENTIDRLELISSRMQARIERSMSLTRRINDTILNAQSQMSDAVQRQIGDVKLNVNGIENNSVSAVSDLHQTLAEVMEPVVIDVQPEPDNLIRLEKKKLQVDKI